MGKIILAEASRKPENVWANSPSREAGTRQTLKIGNAEYGFCWIPAGEFDMGSPTTEEGRDSDETLHHVKLTHGFWMLETETTQALYREVMGSNPSKFKGDNLPVEKVSWYDAMKFCAELTNRLPEGLKASLPTEAQWEYACKAGNGDYKWGDGTALDSGLKGTNPTDNEDPAYNALGRNAYNNATGTYSPTASGLATTSPDVDTTCGTAAVGSFPPNSWGLYDMHGNVYEVCADPYDVNNGYGDTPAEGTAPRVRKGGSYQRGPFRHRASYQLNWNGSATQDQGLRLAITLE